MERKTFAKKILMILGGIWIILLVTLAVLPFLNDLFAVRVTKQDTTVITPVPMPDKPEAVPVTVYYIMEENSKKVSGLYVEVLHSESGTVTYLQVPADTKMDLSAELYKSLQTYGPELPQHLKVANMVESFSQEYGLTAGNRILSELLGVSLTGYVRTTAEGFQDWLELQTAEKPASVFFKTYSEWIAGTESSRSPEERWSYYESRLQVTNASTETAPGSREKDGYQISSKRFRERMEELVHGTEE